MFTTAAASLAETQSEQSSSVTQPQLATPNPSPSPPLPIEGPRIVNVVCGVNLNCRLELRTIALHARNAEYNTRRFQAVTLRQNEPRSSALAFKSGKMQVLGTRSMNDARLAARRFARMIQKVGLRVRITGFIVQNLVAHVNVRFAVRLEGLHAGHGRYASYEPELFPALIYRMMQPKVSLLIFATGKIILLGAKREEDLDDAIKKMFPVLKEFQIRHTV